jgi:hypothetical protein
MQVEEREGEDKDSGKGKFGGACCEMRIAHSGWPGYLVAFDALRECKIDWYEG